MTNTASTELRAVSAHDPSAVRDRFREAMSHVGSSVVVITTTDQSGAPVGLTVGTFTSISMEPPLVGFFAGLGSSTLPQLISSGSFCANVLTEDQHALARSFASRGPDKFAGVDWVPGERGVPLLTGAHAWIECTVEDHRTIGDHELVVGHVDAFDVSVDSEPLIFHRSVFHGLRANHRRVDQ